MPTPRNDFVDLCLELLHPLGSTRAGRMFGGHGIYVDDLFIAIVTGERLYLKTDDATRDDFAKGGGEPFSYDRRGKTMTTSYWTTPAEAMESPASMRPWARRAMAAALRTQAAKPASRKAATKKAAVKQPARKKSATDRQR